MKPSQVLIQHREMIRQAVARHRVANPRVFGSVLHGCDAEGSDLDLLVDPLPETTLLDLGGLQLELEEALGISIDVLTPRDLPADFRETVMNEALPLGTRSDLPQSHGGGYLPGPQLYRGYAEDRLHGRSQDPAGSDS